MKISLLFQESLEHEIAEFQKVRISGISDATVKQFCRNLVKIILEEMSKMSSFLLVQLLAYFKCAQQYIWEI